MKQWKETGPIFSESVELRLIIKNDLEAYRALRLAGLKSHPASFGESAEHFQTLSLSQLEHRLGLAQSPASIETPPNFTLGAFLESGKLIGVISHRRQQGEKSMHRGIIWGFYVSPEARGQGIGRRLLERCLKQASQISGIEQIHLSVVCENTDALHLYTSFGFRSYGLDPNVLKIQDNRYDEHLMVKFLRPHEVAHHHLALMKTLVFW